MQCVCIFRVANAGLYVTVNPQDKVIRQPQILEKDYLI